MPPAKPRTKRIRRPKPPADPLGEILDRAISAARPGPVRKWLIALRKGDDSPVRQRERR
jgi:hypothetical protein